MAYTVSYSQGVDGWVSFYSYLPDWMIGMNNFFYTFNGGNLYRHNVNETRNNFYGQQYSSTLKSVFNDSPLENKLFKTINLEGDSAWDVALSTDTQNNGFINDQWFEKKESSWYAFIRNSGNVPADLSEYPMRSVNGIGRSIVIANQASPDTLYVNFSIQPLIQIGSIISVGDYLYYSMPPSYGTPVLCGQVKDILVDYPNGQNTLIVDTTIVGGSIPSIDTPYFMYIKNSIAESHGVLGHYCVFDIENSSTSKVELFVVESEVMKSYP